MATPAQMFDHELNPVQGWPSQSALDKVANLTTADDTIQAGMGMYLNTAGTWVIGGPTSTTTVAPVVHFAFQNQGDFDTTSDDGNTAGHTIGRLMGLSCTGAYELETTEFVTDSVTYVPGTFLTAIKNGTTGEGTLTPATYGDAGIVICGVVSDIGRDYRHQINSPASEGYSTNENGTATLRFYTCYIPSTS
jgi:hypothetical protein